MDGAGRNGRKLRGIIALLLSLASLADIAAGRAFPVRWLVLVLLRRAEGAAQNYVARAMQVDPAAFSEELTPVAGPADGSPADALLLAWRLRWYAAVLGALLDQLGGADGWTTGRDRVPGRAACRGSARLALAGGAAPGLPPYHDTS